MAKRAEAIMVNLEKYISSHVLGGQCNNFDATKDLVNILPHGSRNEQQKLVKEVEPLVYM